MTDVKDARKAAFFVLKDLDAFSTCAVLELVTTPLAFCPSA